MIKELQKLSWKTPGRLKLLRDRFLHLSDRRTGIGLPAAIRAEDDSSPEVVSDQLVRHRDAGEGTLCTKRRWDDFPIGNSRRSSTNSGCSLFENVEGIRPVTDVAKTRRHGWS